MPIVTGFCAVIPVCPRPAPASGARGERKPCSEGPEALRGPGDPVRGGALRWHDAPVKGPEQPTPALTRDEGFMRVALEEARAALAHDDVPIGCAVVRDGVVIARARNRREAERDPTAHAEMVAIRAAAAAIGDKHLAGCTLYVTLEPCAMCAGAMVLARLERLVYGAMDPKAGAVGSLYDIPRDVRLNHRVQVGAGVLGDECGALLRAFFRARRAN